LSEASSVVQARVDAWNVPPAAERRSNCRTLAAAVLLGPALVFGVVGYAFWGIGGLLPAALALVVSFLILKTSNRALHGSLQPRPADDARLLNIVRGLSGELALDAPLPYLVAGSGVNALVFQHQGHAAIGFTEEALRSYARTELEGVVAHCLARLDPSSGLDRTALTLGGTFAACGTGVDVRDDVRAAAVTRYPPALAKAIEKSTPAEGRYAYLWFAGEPPSHAPVEARIRALSEL
jgi:hypothetical protein